MIIIIPIADTIHNRANDGKNTIAAGAMSRIALEIRANFLYGFMTYNS
jgi:hypothetical protein